MTRDSRSGGSQGRSASIRSASARSVAVEVMRAVETKDAYANLELPALLRRSNLSPADAAFATELTYGTLRMQGFYDAVIESAAARRVDTIDGVVRDILRLGAHQSLTLHTPAHAVVDESGALTRRFGSVGAVGFVNAVMRRITERDVSEWQSLVTADLAPDDVLSLSYSHPAWIVRALRGALAHEGSADEIAELLQSDNDPARVTLVTLSEHSAVPHTESGNYSPRALVLRGGDPHEIEAVARGSLRIQDEGSQLAALALTRSRPIRSDEKWLDMCAGPGGKTALLAAESAGTGVTILANESSAHRAELVRQAVKRFPHVNVEVGDGRLIGVAHPHSFDRILVDAPCSGLGALRRRPEARWRRTPQDVATLTGLQSELLASAIVALKPGGVLAYVTCSPHLVETRAILNRALKENPHVRELDAREVLSRVTHHSLDLRGTDLSVQLWPHRHGTDAMFIALLTTTE
jgi:16S rRNA (cytosine967-C5)-methyltransferase